MSRCNSCGCDPCGGGCCKPARYSCDFSIQVDPYNPYVWLLDNCGKISRVNIPKIPETDTFLKVDFSSASLVYDAEYHQDVIPGCDLGSIINLDCLRDVEAPTPDSCDLLVFDPGCSECGDGCKPKPAMWRNYHIPDAEDCEVELDEDGYYHVLIKDDCGCIRECRLPAIPDDNLVISYTRDSVPDDPDFPWYYGSYNDTINLHLRENAARYFGKFDLRITVNYGIQTIKSTHNPGYNWRSIVVPVVEGQSINTTMEASILQNWSTAGYLQRAGQTDQEEGGFPWGSCSLRGSFTFIVPKGKEAYLHHEYRIRTMASFPKYYPKDSWPTPESWAGDWNGTKVPVDAQGHVPLDSLAHPASRMNALQIMVEPTKGHSDFNPVKDADRDKLDYPTDTYVNPVA